MSKVEVPELTGQVFECVVDGRDCAYGNAPWIGIFSGPGDPSARSMKVDRGDRFEILEHSQGPWYLCKALNAGKLYNEHYPDHEMDPDDFVFSINIEFHVNSNQWFRQVEVS
jgi:hypothetical protein